MEEEMLNVLREIIRHVFIRNISVECTAPATGFEQFLAE